MAFIMDMSGSVGARNFRAAKTFVADIVRSFSIGANRTRVGLITYSTRPHVQFHLNQYDDSKQTVAAIRRVPYKGGWTHTGEAILAMLEQLFNQSVESGTEAPPTTRPDPAPVTAVREIRTGIASSPIILRFDVPPFINPPPLPPLTPQAASTSPPLSTTEAVTTAPTQALQPIQLKSKVGVIVTDGKAQDDVLEPSLQAHRLGFTLFAIGVGKSYKLSELKEIASDPDQAHVYTVGDYSAIDNIRASVRQRSCLGELMCENVLRVAWSFVDHELF